ncbi:MAG: RluA family pseudouridine synthase [Planctomycetota bacterium]
MSESSQTRIAARLRVVLIDDQIVVVEKPAGMPSVPARTPLDPPDVARVLRTLPEFAGEEGGLLEAAHRLDRDTSGLLVLARSHTARRSLGLAFERRQVRKRYLAVVAGWLPRPAGTIHLPLAADPSLPPRQRIDPIWGRPAISRWQVIATATDALAKSTSAGWSLVELEPVTGRSHQLRAHLAWLGAPILGDHLYSRSAAAAQFGADPPAPPAPHEPSAAFGDAGRLCLHATRLEFPHPATGRLVSLHAPVCLSERTLWDAVVMRPTSA